MVRKERPLERSPRYNALLGLFLRQRRANSGRSYNELAGRCAYSRQTLQRAAAGGPSVPPWPVVEAFILATAGDQPEPWETMDTQRALENAKSQWRKARYEHRQKILPPRSEPPVLALVRDEADVSAVLIELYELAGAPSMQTMEKQAGGMGRLPHSTAHRIITRQALPSSFEQFNAFLTACEVRPAKREPWHKMWIRVFGQATAETTPTPPFDLRPGESTSFIFQPRGRGYFNTELRSGTGDR
ncbi:helix-turn-helix domain-containing protein [Streptomyces sp. NPDC048416]|uniref:helix-turn-helix domain-containing protein n=1 Tax=Streptomyces sp. NPDC048416 TaxID=3365546 RepID=UPI00372030FC